MSDYTFAQVSSFYEAAKQERADWETEWKDISEFLLPGRGRYGDTKPDKRKLYSSSIINSIATDALNVLISGMHGGLTSPALPWFRLSWKQPEIEQFEPLKAWLQQCNDRMHQALQFSNFYSVIAAFYEEYCGFGTGCIYVGEDTYDEAVPARWELLTAGEYAFSLDATGKVNSFFRMAFMSPQQLVDTFGDKVSATVKKYVDDDLADKNKPFVAVLEMLEYKPYMGKPITRYVYEYNTRKDKESREYLQKTGFFEFPYLIARWSTIGSDIYGIGPGSRALPDVRRLQEMEAAFLMAVHKTVEPPVMAPVYMKGKLRTLPGAENYYRNPNEVVKELYQVRFDLPGVTHAIERVEHRIQANFYNDIFLTAARDPNATPYKAAEVAAREQEKMLRLGPVIERLQHEFFQPLIERLFNIMLRKEMFELLDPKLAEIAGEYKIALISPLAAAQRGVALQGINSFLAFIGGAAQFDQEVLDNVDVDEAARVYADITGVNIGVLRPMEEVQARRQARQRAMAEAQAKQEAMAMAQVAGQTGQAAAAAAKTQAEAGQILTETQQTALQAGVL